MVVDGVGRAYIGGIDNGDRSRHLGTVILVQPAGAAAVLAQHGAAPGSDGAVSGPIECVEGVAVPGAGWP